MSIVLFTLVTAAGDSLGSDGPNLWGALGCAVAYAGAVFAGVEGICDYVLQRDKHEDIREQRALRLKMGAKVSAAVMTVVTAAIVLIIDSNWFAFIGLSLAFIGIMLWVFYVSRENAKPPTRAND